MKEVLFGLKLFSLYEGLKNNKILMTLWDFHWGGNLLMLLDEQHLKHNN